jgi:PAS domain S-box-containing protein
VKPNAQTLLDACAYAVLAINPASGIIVASNVECENLLGYSQASLLGRPLADIEISLHDLFFWEEVRQSSTTSVSAVQSEYRHENGSLITVQKTVRCFPTTDGQLCVLSVHDVSSAKRLEDETAHNASLLAATLESTHDGILVTDLDGNIRNFNHRIHAIWQWQPTDNDMSLFAHMAEQQQDPAGFLRWLDTLYQDPYHNGQLECPLKDGRVLELTSTPQLLKNQAIGRLITMHDISELKTIEEQLRLARDAAQAANRAKSDFLSHMSHELRTPLNAILGFAQILETEADPTAHELGSYIAKAGWHLLELINEVLDLASIDAGKMKLKIEPVDLTLIIQDCCELTRHLASAKQIHLTEPHLPQGRFMAQVDARRIKQMLLNLISNAIKYNRSGGRVEITITAADETHWRLMVSDTGNGISDRDQALLFQPFSRVGTHQLDIEGTGIGLAFTRKLAHLMRGEVGMDSTLEQGSRFWINLPCAIMQVPPSMDSSLLKNLTLLYIEDDPLSQQLLERIIAHHRPNYLFLLASDAASGIALALTAEPDLILLDMHLPDASGAAVLEQLGNNENTRQIPVMAISGDAAEEEIALAKKIGFDGYLTKPLKLDSTLALIDEMLMGKKLRRL